MKTAMVLVLGLALALVSAGCTTAMLNLPGGASLMQPKDVTIKEGPAGQPGLIYTDGKGSTLTVQNYTSSANVGAMQAQAGLVQGVVAQAVSAAVKAAVPETAAVPVMSGVLTTPETPKVVPAAVPK